jgi:hypothetical protein
VRPRFSSVLLGARPLTLACGVAMTTLSAAAPGNVADDGEAKCGNGLYVQILVKESGDPAAKIEDVFKRVHMRVRKQSQVRQMPWEGTSLEEDLFFCLYAQLDRTIDGDQFQQVTDAPLREQADWSRINTSSQADDRYAFLQKYPNGLISEQAQCRLDRPQRPGVAGRPGANGVKMLASGTKVPAQLNAPSVLRGASVGARPSSTPFRTATSPPTSTTSGAWHSKTSRCRRSVSRPTGSSATARPSTPTDAWK